MNQRKSKLKIFYRTVAMMWLFFGVLNLFIGGGSTSIVCLFGFMANLIVSCDLSRIPGGFCIGQVEFYRVKNYRLLLDDASLKKLIQSDRCPMGCRLISIGWFGVSLLNKQCLELFKDTAKSLTK